jgi:hypothetical protein
MGQTEISGRCYVRNGELDVVDFACAKSRRIGILHNLSDMRRKPSAGFGLRLDRVPVAYQRTERDNHDAGKVLLVCVSYLPAVTWL